MKLPLFIAKRYLFNRKRGSVVGIISWISLAGIAVSTMALVIVLSVYNGIGKLTQTLFNVFDPELVIQPAKGKTFHTSDIDYAAIKALPTVSRVSEIAEENAWLTRRQAESIVQLRGVDTAYAALSGIDTMIYDGEYLLNGTWLDPDGILQPIPYMVFGAEIFYSMGLNASSNEPVAIHIPKRGSGLGLTVEDAFNNGYAYPAGNFFIQQDIDNRYVITHIDLVRQLMDYAPDEVTALAVQTTGTRSALNRSKKALRQILGPEFTVKDRFEQQPLYYKIFRSERLGVYLILSLIVLISTLNLIASLSLLIIDKRKDIATLRSMGMPTEQIRRTFVSEGLLISLVGVAVGMFVGFVICLLQQQFGIVKMGHGNFISPAFPVAMRPLDFLITLLLVMTLSALSVLFTVRRAKVITQ